MNSRSLEFEQQLSVSRETLAKLERYVGLIHLWSPRINLISRSTLPDVWSRHVLDSAQLLSLVREEVGHWLDIGSGGGFPGLVVGILSQERDRLQKLTLIESDQRKCAFLSTVLRETRVKGEVICARSEDTSPMAADVVSARALAPLETLLGHASRHLAPDGTALFLKGARYEQELTKALDSWSFRCETHPSKTDANAVILSISEIERA